MPPSVISVTGASRWTFSFHDPMEFSFDEPALIAANLIEIALLVVGCIVLYRWRFGERARILQTTRLLPWTLSASGFLTRGLFAVLGGLGFQFLTLHLQSQHKSVWTEDLWIVVHNLAMQVGLFFGILLGMVLSRTKHRDSGPVEAAANLTQAETEPAPHAALRMNTVLAGLLLFLGSLPMIALTSLLSSLALKAAGIDAGKQELVDLLLRSKSPLLIAGMAVLAVVFAPIIEETVFRAGVFRYLRTRIPRTAAFLLSAVFFSALHNNLAAFVPLVVFGLILAYVYERTGRLAICVFAHAFFNLHTLVILLITLKN